MAATYTLQPMDASVVSISSREKKWRRNIFEKREGRNIVEKHESWVTVAFC